MFHPAIIRHNLRHLQGIAERKPDWPNSAMPKALHLGEKLKAEMERVGLKPAQIAEKFGVKPPSVYDWIEFGRIHKKHFTKLVETFGRPLDWWLDMEPDRTSEAHFDSTAAVEAISATHRRLIDLFEGLPGSEQRELLDQLEERVERYEAIVLELTERRRAAPSAH